MADTTEKTVENYIGKHGMLAGVENVVAGVSGGADSMCMLHILGKLREKYGYRLVVVHIHHGIRGKDADEDMEYVEKSCSDWNIEFRSFQYKVEELAKKWHMSTEEAGRKVRYDSFYRVLTELGGGRIAVAHNSDDNNETFLLNLFRGTGIRGLTGIRPVRQDIIRPVLCLGRVQILEYLKENGIDYRTDVTNEGDLYTRNKIRNRILPYVRQNINDRASEHIFQAADALNEICCYMDKQAEHAYSNAVENKKGVYTIKIPEIRKYDAVLQKMVCRKAIEGLAGKLKDITAVHVDMILEIMAGATGKRVNLPYNIVCEKSYQTILLYREGKAEAAGGPVCIECNIDSLAGEKIQLLPENKGVIRLKLVKNVIRNVKIEEKMYTKWLDYDILKSTFQIRNRRDGDYIVINRNGGRKKIKDYFIDLKIPREERDNILLLAKGSEIFWVIGYRISESCKLSEKTENILQIEYFPGKAASDIQQEKVRTE